LGEAGVSCARAKRAGTADKRQSTPAETIKGAMAPRRRLEKQGICSGMDIGKVSFRKRPR
jgi:hypothetical protein